MGGHMTFHKHMVAIFICIPFAGLMNNVNTFAESYCSCLIIL